MKFSRDDWMVMERGLQDRIASLTSDNKGGILINHEIEKCERLRKVLNAHIDATWVNPEGNKK